MTTCNLSRLMICLQKIKHLEWWRLCFFLATVAPICWATSLAVKLLVMAVESQLFIAKNVLYFMAAIKVTPFYCAVMQVFAVDQYVSQYAVRLWFSSHSVAQCCCPTRCQSFSLLQICLCFAAQIQPCPQCLPTFGRTNCHLCTEVPWPTLLLQYNEKLTVGAETADLVSTLCHCAACVCGNHASKG